MRQKKVLYTGLDPTHYKANGQIVHWPLIQIQPISSDTFEIQQAFAAFSSYTHVILTSKSTIPILSNYLSQFGYSIADWTSKANIVVGQVTAYCLRQYGIEPFLIAEEETAEGILAQISPSVHRNDFFFWPHSAQSRSVIFDFFRAHQLKLAECSIYETVTRLPSIKPSLEEFDEIVFTSPSTVKAFIEVFGSLPKHTTLTPIGPVTSAYLQSHALLA